MNPHIEINDIVTLKKEHPCGGKTWQILRVGMDFKMRCLTCGREVMAPRRQIEKNIKKVTHREEE